jgi:hypothetical protein
MVNSFLPRRVYPRQILNAKRAYLLFQGHARCLSSILIAPVRQGQQELAQLAAGDSIGVAISVACYAVLGRGRSTDDSATGGTNGCTSKNRSGTGTGSRADDGAGCSTQAAANQCPVSLAVGITASKGSGREGHQKDLFHFVNL